MPSLYYIYPGMTTYMHDIIGLTFDAFVYMEATLEQPHARVLFCSVGQFLIIPYVWKAHTQKVNVRFASTE